MLTFRAFRNPLAQGRLGSRPWKLQGQPVLGVGLGVVGVVSFFSAAIFASPCPLRPSVNFAFRRTLLGT